MAITPDWQPHADLETEVNLFLNEMGFDHGSATYHSVLEPGLQRLLRRNNDPTSLYIRTRADRLAVHKKYRNCTFQYECKTSTGDYTNMAVEAIQLAQHIFAEKLGVRSLYVYRDIQHDIDCGFWNSSIPEIDCIMVPPGNEGITGVLAIAFPDVPVVRLAGVRGGGDAFCKIDAGNVIALRSWKDLIADCVAQFSE